MLVVFVSVAAVLAVGTATFFAYQFKQERDTLNVKFKQAQDYADSTAKANTVLTSANRTLSNEIITAKETITEQTKVIVNLKNSQNTAKVVSTHTPINKSNKAKPGRPSKKAVA